MRLASQVSAMEVEEVEQAVVLLRLCKLIVGTPETPELVRVGWDLALAYVLCPCC